MKTRLAPTPSGWLHIGNGASFVLTWLLARAMDGKLILRIDDIDKGRRRTEYIEDIFETIDWLGIDYDEGPSGVDDFLQNWSQHLRLYRYQEALDQLWGKRDLYACDCSRKTWQSLSQNNLYPGICRDKQLPKDQANLAWRILVPDNSYVQLQELNGKLLNQDLCTIMGDFVVRQKNGLPAYQIVSLIDDLDYEVDTIIRGADLLSSSLAQTYLAAKLGYKTFTTIKFWHHPLFLDSDGQKLSKTKGAPALVHWRELGETAAKIYQIVANWLDLDLVGNFQLDDLVQATKEKLA